MRTVCRFLLILMLTTGCMPHNVVPHQPSPTWNAAPDQPVPTRKIEATPNALMVIQHLADLDIRVQGQILDVQQTIAGITVTIHWLYVDTERLLIGYTVEAPPGSRYHPSARMFRSEDGSAFRLEGSWGFGGTSDNPDLSLPPGYTAHMAEFQVGDQHVTTRESQLHFMVVVEKSPQPRHHGAQEGSVIIVQVEPTGRPIGPFIFDLPLP